MNSVVQALNENLRVIYRKSVDADSALNSLQSQGKGKFNTIFADGSGFVTRSKRFGPYVEELAGEVSVLADAPQAQVKIALPALVKKIELMLKTLEQFKKTL
jgi:hypothetical protein